MDPNAAQQVSDAMQFLSMSGGGLDYWTTLMQHLGSYADQLGATPGSYQASRFDDAQEAVKEFYLAKDIAQGRINSTQANAILQAYNTQKDLESKQRILQNDKSYLAAIESNPSLIQGGMTPEYMRNSIARQEAYINQQQGVIDRAKEGFKDVSPSSLEFTQAMGATPYSFKNAGEYNFDTERYEEGETSPRNIPDYLALQQTQNLQQQAQTTQQQSPRTQQILSLLPADWNTYTPANKRFWFESNGVTRADLEAAGIPQTDINALYAQAAVEKKSNQVTSGLLDTNDQTTNVTNQTATGLLNANISLADASAVFQSLFGKAPSEQQLRNFASIAANDPRLASRSAFEAYLRGTPDYLALQQQTQQQQGLTNITQQQAIDTFKSIFGRVPNSSELANFLAYQRGSTPFTSTDALAAYLRSTPDFAAYQARQALPPMTYGRAVVPQSQLQYGYGPEQGLLTNIKGPTGQQIQNQMDAFYAASYGGTPTAGLLAPAIAQMANQQQPPNFYAMPTGAPSMQELTQRAQGLLDQGYTMADLRSQAMQNNLSPQVTGAILSNVQQGGATPYLQGLLSGELPLVAGQNLLAAR
jgi:hypothetical protein